MPQPQIGGVGKRNQDAPSNRDRSFDATFCQGEGTYRHQT